MMTSLRKTFAMWAMVLGTVLCLNTAFGRAEGIEVKDGQKIAFLGDSITQFGNNTPAGYVRLVISGLEANGINTTYIPAGISGQKSNDMLGRVGRDVINKKPDWMTLSCGVNDVWHGAKGVPLDDYKKNMTAIVDKAQAAGIKVMILTSTMIREDATNGENQRLVVYNDFLRALAKEKSCLLADLNADMQAAVHAAGGGKPGDPNVLTADGVHMALPGNLMMATGVLRSFGLNPAQLQKSQDFWTDMPNACETSPKFSITIRQYNQLKALAATQNRSVNDLINDTYRKSVESLLAPSK